MANLPNNTIENNPNAAIVKAWAEGKTIQLKVEDNWADYRWNYHVSPMSVDGLKYQWRVKPETKTGWINIYRAKFGHMNTLSPYVYGSEEEANAQTVSERIACIQITYEV